MRMRTQTRPDLRWHPVLAGRLLAARHPALRYAQILPVGLVLWGLDDVARFRAGAAHAGLQNAVVVNSISNTIGGHLAHLMNDWTLAHGAAALASAWYYILFQGAITGVVGVMLIWRRAPAFSVHRNALISVTLLGLVAFWLYQVAPPRMLPGYHDVIAIAFRPSPAWSTPNGAAQFRLAAIPACRVGALGGDRTLHRRAAPAARAAVGSTRWPPGRRARDRQSLPARHHHRAWPPAAGLCGRPGTGPHQAHPVQ